MGDIHNSAKRKRKVEEKLETKCSYSKQELDAIQDFKLSLEEEGQSQRRVQRYLQTFNRLDEEIDFNLTDPEIRDVRQLIARINNRLDQADGSEYSPWTLAEYRKGLKKFYIHHAGRQSDIVQEVKWKLQVKKSNRPISSPDELPKPSEVKSMVRKAESSRNKALIFFLWDTGCRISEALNVKWGDIVFREKQAEISIKKSKSQPRKIPVYECVEHLREWKTSSPASQDEDYIFVNTGTRGPNKESRGDQMSYNSAYSQIKKCASRIECEYSPHDFRRGRATFLASQGFNAPTMCEYFGWSDFESAERYIQLAKKDVESAMAELQGIDESNGENEENSLRPVKCRHCDCINPATRDYCKECECLISKEKELLRESVMNDEKQKVRDEAITTLVEEFDLDEEIVEEKIREKTRQRMEDKGFYQ